MVQPVSTRSASARGAAPDPTTFEDRYSTASQPLATWVVDQLDLASVASVADVGCGNGRFALPLARALAARAESTGVKVEVCAVDRSAVDLSALERAAGHEQLPIRTINSGAVDEALFPHGSVDLVMTNFVLHLLPRSDVRTVITNARRWLRPEGGLLITGFGSGHMSSTLQWLERGLISLGRSAEQATEMTERAARQRATRSFVLEDGIRCLAPHFSEVTYRRFDEHLVVGVEALADLTMGALTGRGRIAQEAGLAGRDLAEAILHAMWEDAVDGRVRVNADRGIVLAGKPRLDERF